MQIFTIFTLKTTYFQPVSEYYTRCDVITLINVHRLTAENFHTMCFLRTYYAWRCVWQTCFLDSLFFRFVCTQQPAHIVWTSNVSAPLCLPNEMPFKWQSKNIETPIESNRDGEQEKRTHVIHVNSHMIYFHFPFQWRSMRLLSVLTIANIMIIIVMTIMMML